MGEGHCAQAERLYTVKMSKSTNLQTKCNFCILTASAAQIGHALGNARVLSISEDFFIRDLCDFSLSLAIIKCKEVTNSESILYNPK